MLDVAYMIYQTARISAGTVFDSLTRRLTRERSDERLHGWGQRIIDRLDLQVDVRGKEAVDWSRSYVIMSNHQSHLDIPVLAWVVPGSLRFVAKKELFRVPLWGRAMLDSGMVRIDRGNRKEAIASLRQAGETIRSGIHVWIAPEGTRSRTGELGPLKKGGFVLALETGVPILPVAISGTYEALPPKTYRPRHGMPVKILFGQPIDVAGQDRDALLARVEQFFKENTSPKVR